MPNRTADGPGAYKTLIYICITAHNEERTAGILLWKIRRVMSEFERDYQILFLDDASSDRTAAVVEQYKSVLPLEILRHKGYRHGYGASLEELLREVVSRCEYPRRDVIITIQADFTEEPAFIPDLVKRIEGGADLVVAAQPLDGQRCPRTLRWVRKGLPWLEKKFDFPDEISDPFSGFRAYRVSVVKKALQARNGGPLLRRGGWGASIELLLATAPHARRLEEAAAPFRYDRRVRSSRLSPWIAAREFLGLLRGS